MASISIRNLDKAYGKTRVLHGINLEIADNSFVVFVGPSGCGKTTLLRLIAGLEDVTGGQILIDGKNVVDVPPAKRGLSMVFQSYALYPHMSVRGNIAFGLKMAGLPRAEIDRKVQAAAATLNLTPYLDRKPRELSGGQRQRVAIGRAIVKHHPGAIVTPMLVPHGTDSVKLRVKGIKAYGLTPMVLDMATAGSMHSDTEHIPVNEFLTGLHIFYDLLSSEY